MTKSIYRQSTHLNIRSPDVIVPTPSVLQEIPVNTAAQLRPPELVLV